MAIIELVDLKREFRQAKRFDGPFGAIRTLVTREYTTRTALDNITFAIEPGESVAYLGPNGAGKSTTIKILTGILVPSAGHVRVLGNEPHHHRQQNAQRIGVVFGQRSQLWWDLPVQESLRLLGDIYQVPREIFARSLGELVELLELDPLLRMPARQLSLGQRMRCDLAASLIHQPAILYLDEPTIGLDVAVKERIRQFIKQINQERAITVLLTSHDLGDIENLCRRLVMIDRGRIVFDGPLQAIKERFGRERMVHLVLHEALPAAAATAELALAGFAPALVQQTDDYRLTVQFDTTTATVGGIASRLLSALPVDDMKIDEPSIESIIRGLYEGKLQLVEGA